MSEGGAGAPPALSEAALREWLRHLTDGQAELVTELHRQSLDLPARIQAAVAAGVAVALTNRETLAQTLSIVVDVAQDRTAQQAGRFVVGWAGRMLRNAAIVLVFGWLAIKLFGWDVAAAIGKFASGLAKP